VALQAFGSPAPLLGDALAAELAQDVAHWYEGHAAGAGDEETGRFELRVGDSAGAEGDRPAVAEPLQLDCSTRRRERMSRSRSSRVTGLEAGKRIDRSPVPAS
jgi:hypothetical protein